MAKLEGVKVLDMVNGEVTRVEYGGEVYEKVDDKALAGDLAYANRDGLNTTAGSFYEVIYSTNRFLEYLDDKNYNHKWDYDGTFSLFRKVAVQPILADRVAALEEKSNDLEKRVSEIEKGIEVPEVTINGVKYRKATDRDPRVGDYVKFDEAPHCYLTAGKYYEIVKFDGADPIIIDDDGDEYDTCGEEFEVYEKVTEKFNACKAKDRPTVGDFVRVSKHCPYNNLAGKYLKIINDDMSDIPYTAEYLDGNCAGWLLEEDVEKVTDENALKFLRIGRKPGEFKVGDIVKGPKGNSFVDIFEVIEIREGSTFPIRFINRNGENDGFSAQANLTLIAPVEARVDRP